jgi:hypothetical protein
VKQLDNSKYKPIATALKILLPIVKIPTNIAKETLEYSTGSITGAAKLASAYAKGIENLKPEEADIILRHLKKGSIGLAGVAIGFFNPDMFGGYYRRGHRTKEGEPDFGGGKLFGYTVPPFLVHNPLLETFQIGATMRKVNDERLKGGGTKGLTAGALAALFGLAEEVPFTEEMRRVVDVIETQDVSKFAGNTAKQLVPLLLQQIAARADREDGKPVKRAPKTFPQYIETGIPGLRQNVPKAKRQ